MQVVSISSLKGGVGKTSVTLGLASAALTSGVRTLVVDLDPHGDATTGLNVVTNQLADIGHMLEKPRKAGLAHNVATSGWLNKNRRFPDAKNHDRRPRLDVAQGSSYTGIFDRPDLSRRDLRRLKTLLDAVEEDRYDFVLIDCPPSLNGLTKMAWTASDHVILVAEPALFSVAGTERTLRAIDLFGKEYAPGLEPLGVVANRVREESVEHQFRLEEMDSLFGSLLLQPILHELSGWQQIQGAAQAVHHWPGEAARQAAGRFDQLFARLSAADKQ